MSQLLAPLVVILPAAVLIGIGGLVRSSIRGEISVTPRSLLLLGVLALLLAAVFGAALSGHHSLPLFSLWFALLPTLSGTLAALFLQLSSRATVWSRSIQALPLLLVVLGLFVGIGSLGDLGTLVYIPVVGAALIVLVWQAGVWVGKWAWAAYMGTVMLLLVSLWATDADRLFVETPLWLAGVVRVAVDIAPGIAIIVAARLVLAGRADGQPILWRKVVLSFALIDFLLLLVGYQVELASIWDAATDGLRSFIVVWLIGLGVAAAIPLAWSLPGKRKLAALAFAVVVSASMEGAQWIGSYGPSGQWGRMPTVVTEQRAETVSRAIRRYYAHNGNYPTSLTELIPSYQVFVPHPLIIPGETWCYAGGHDYSRLGYVYRQSFSSPTSVRIHAAVGEPPGSAWGCP